MSQSSKRALITTVPFGDVDPRPSDLLRTAGISYDLNPVGRRLQEDELADLITYVNEVVLP